MNSKLMVVASHRLNIQNPYRLRGSVLLLTGCVLGAIVLFRFWSLAPVAPTILKQLGEGSPDVRTMTAGFLAILGVCLAGAIFQSVRIVWQACTKTLVFFAPSGIPGPLDRPETTPYALLDRREIEYEQPSTAMRIAAAVFSGKFRYARGETREIIGDLLRSLCLWGLVLPVLCVPAVLPEDFRASIHLPGAWPLPSQLAIVAGFAVVIRSLATLTSVPRVPRVEVREVHEHLTTTGNPVNHYNHLQRAAEDAGEEGFTNRKMRDSAPVVVTEMPGGNHEFCAQLLLETQPLPVHRGVAVNALALELGGAILLWGGYTLLLFFPESLARSTLNGYGPYMELCMRLFAGLVGVCLAVRFLRSGGLLHEVFHFESDIIRISLKGTYTVSEIGVGDGRGGTIILKRKETQSDTHVDMRGTHVLSECRPGNGRDALEAPRAVLDSSTTPAFEKRFELLRHAIVSFVDSGGQLPDVDLTHKSIQKVVDANAQISRMQTASPQLPLPPGERGVPLGNALEFSHDPDAEKVCPDCGEKIKKMAKVCRFCHHRFEPPPAS